MEGYVRKLPGESDVSVKLLKNSMLVSYDENSLNTAEIADAVENTGYSAEEISVSLENKSAPGKLDRSAADEVFKTVVQDAGYT